MADRAASEVLGFVLVFGLMMTTIGTVYVGGFDSLTEARNAQQQATTERAFDLLAANMDAIGTGTAPVRTTEIQLSGGRLRLRDGPEIAVTLTSGTSGTPTFSRSMSPIVYEFEETETSLVYTNGAVMRVDRAGAVLKRSPPFVFRTDGADHVAVVPIIATRLTGTTAVADSRTARIRADHASTVLLNPQNVTAATTYRANLTITTTAARASVWERHLDAEILAAYGTTDACDRVGGDRVACEFDVNRLYVTATYVDVTLSE